MSTVGEGVDKIANDKQIMASFERLVHTYKDPLYCILLRMTGQQELAVRLLKEVFVKIYNELPYKDHRKFLIMLFLNIFSHICKIHLLKKPEYIV